MSHYKSNVRDLEFNVFEVFGAGERMGTGPFAEMDEQTARGILEEVNRLAVGPLAESFEDADRNPPIYDPATKSVTMPEGFKKSFRALMESEWWRLDLPQHIGGAGAPPSLRWAASELMLGANPAAFLFMSGPNFAAVIDGLGTEEQKKFAAMMIDKGWGATMVLTEPDAGSDVGAGRAKAFDNGDGTWRIEGVKRFITSAEHDRADNIVHLVLARPDGAGPGTKGLSLFI
ncbi:MAG: acyl-CoA dehydrogenase family protein, partial [Actinomycetota bacterium]